MKRRSPKLTYANVTATAALILALAGGTTAVALSGHNSVRSDDIRNEEVRSPDLAGSSVKGAEVKANSLKAGDLAADSVTGSEVAPAAVGSGEIADGGVGPDEIAPGAVNSSEIAPNAVGAAAVLDGSLGPEEQGAAPAARIEGTGFTPQANFLTVAPLESDTTPGTFDPFDMWTPADPEFVRAPIDGVYLVVGTGTWDSDDTATAGGPQDQGDRTLQIGAPDQQSIRAEAETNRFEADLTRQVVTALVELDAGEALQLLVTEKNEDDSDVELIEYSLQTAWIGPG
jgi:hypothetical protein